MAKLYLSYDEFESCAKGFVAISDKLRDGWEERRVQILSNPERDTVFLVKRLSLLLNDCSDLKDQTESDHTSLEQLENGEGFHIEEEDDPAIISSSGKTSLHPSNLPYADQTNLVSSQSVASTVAESSLSPALSVHVEYHIVHSFSYEVPVLYFNATYPNGRQLSLKDTWKLLSDRFISVDMDRWGLVSQQEHPLLNCPVFHIHPCHTAEVMAQARKTRTSSEDANVNVETEGEGERKKNEEFVASNGGNSRTSGVEKGELSETSSKSESNYLVTWLSTFGPLVGLKVPLEYATVN